MKKILFLAITMVIAHTIYAQESVRDYFYKNITSNYTFLPTSSYPQDVEINLRQYGWDPVIQEITYFKDENGYNIGSTSTIYSYTYSGNSIISKGQLIKNIMGISKTSYDNLTILTTPLEKSSWTEYRNGEKYNCKSEWVYVSYQRNNGEKVVDKAIKMSNSIKITIDNQVTNKIEYSYWTKKSGFIASYGSWGAKEVTPIRLANFISFNEPIKEVSEKEYADYLVEEILKEEARKKAELEKKYQKFVQNLKPQKLSVANENASKSITELFLNLEEERYTQMVLNDMLKLEEKTELYVSIPPESEFYVEVPDGEKDTVASLISDLLVKGILKIATVTEPNTQRTCSLEQYLSESYSVQVETLTFDVVKTKDSWRLADKKAVMPRDYATYIKQAAQNVYDTNKKAKKQTVELRKLRIINNNDWDNARIKIWHVQKDIANPDKNKYVLL